MILDKLFAARSVPPENPGERGSSVLFGMPAAGVRVDEETSLNYSAVWAAVNMIANTVSIVSWQVYERQDGFRQRLFDDPLARLLNVEPNPEMTPSAFKKTMVMHSLLWGKPFAEIDRKGNSQPQALWPIHPSRVKTERNSAGAIVHRIDGGQYTVRDENMFCPVGLSPDGITGYSVIRTARESISMGLSMEKFGASFFGNDARPSFVVKAPEKISEKAENNIREWLQRHHGSPSRSWKPAVLEQGMEVQQVGIPPEDAQFLESRKFQVSEIARWFNMPPHKIGDLERATFSNIDSRERMFVTEAILPWTRAYEEEANRKLIATARRSRIYTKFDLNTLMRADVATRSEFYNTMFNVGAYSPNDIRMFEDMNPVPGGNQRLVPGNMVPLSQAGSQMAPQQAMFDVFLDAAERMLRKEYKALTRALDNGKISDEEYETWVLDFYKQHRDDLIQAFTPCVESLCQVHGGSFPTQVLSQEATNYCSRALDFISTSETLRDGVYQWTQQGRDLARGMIDAVSEGMTDQQGGSDESTD